MNDSARLVKTESDQVRIVGSLIFTAFLFL